MECGAKTNNKIIRETRGARSPILVRLRCVRVYTDSAVYAHLLASPLTGVGFREYGTVFTFVDSLLVVGAPTTGVRVHRAPIRFFNSKILSFDYL